MDRIDASEKYEELKLLTATAPQKDDTYFKKYQAELITRMNYKTKLRKRRGRKRRSIDYIDKILHGHLNK